MEVFRRIVFWLGAAAFIVCSLGLNGMGGLAILTMSDEKYADIGRFLLLSTGCFIVAFVMLIFKKTLSDIVSLVFSTLATVFYALPINALSSIPNDVIPKDKIDVLTGRIYPSIAVSVLFGLSALLGIFSYERISERQKRRDEKDRDLHEDERIV